MVGKDMLVINVKIKDKALDVYNEILEEFSFTNNSEAIRFIITQYWKLYKGEREFIKTLSKDVKELSASNVRMMTIFEKMQFRVKNSE